jgi:hypothetical protein
MDYSHLHIPTMANWVLQEARILEEVNGCNNSTNSAKVLGSVVIIHSLTIRMEI